MPSQFSAGARLTTPAEIFDRQLIFVTGKGGTGKSSIAAALGDVGAGLGKRTLLIETDERGNLTDFLEMSRVGFEPVEVKPNLSLMTLNTEDSLREYLKIFLKMGRISKLPFLSRIFDFVANAAPGVKEILTIGKITYEASRIIDNAYCWDLIIADAAPIGRIIGQLDAPAAIGDLIQSGMVKDQTRWMSSILGDSRRCALIAVATPEEMPVVETTELAVAMDDIDVSLELVVVNRVMPELFTSAEERCFEELRAVEPLDVLRSQFGAGIEPVFDAALLAVAMRRSRVEHMRELIDGTGLPTVLVPYLFIRQHGLRSTHLIGDSIRLEMGL